MVESKRTSILIWKNISELFLDTNILVACFNVRNELTSAVFVKQFSYHITAYGIAYKEG